jgi:transposase
MSNTATISYQWGLIGKQPQVVCKQRQRERQTVFGSCNYDTGQMTVTFADKGNSKTFKKHLQKVLQAYPATPKIIMVLDNVAYHHARRIKEWLGKQNRLELFFLPPYSPDLNAIERVWWYMRKKITHNRYLKTLKMRKIEFWKMFSHFLKPNATIKTVCEINY